MQWRVLILIGLGAIFSSSSARAAAPGHAEAFSHPARDVLVALEDLTYYRPIASRKNIRYLSLYHMTLEERERVILATSLHVNHLSRSPVLAAPVVIYQRNKADGRSVPVLMRVDMTHYGWKAETWEKLAPVNVYYNVTRDFEEKVKGKKVVKEQAVAARWLPKEPIGLLLLLTRSQTPIVRADWFFTQTVIQKNRAVGYYEWIQVKNRDDFFKLTGADYNKAGRAGKEWQAILQKSGVAQRNRQVVRFGAIDAGAWFTKDAFKNETRRRNAVNFLNGDFQHDAEEIIIPLPNGLFGYLACDDKGVLQDAAPSDVGADTTSTSNDPDIHVYLSCVRCHDSGLRRLRDYGRELFTGDRRLVVREDDRKFQRFVQLYLRPLERHRVRDVLEYTTTLKDVAADMDPSLLAELYREVWKRWHDDSVDLAQAAREIGTVTAEQLRAAITLYATPTDKGGLGKILPLSLLGFTDPKNRFVMLRSHYEEAYDAIHLVLEETSRLRKR